MIWFWIYQVSELTRGYLFQSLHKTSLKESETVFLDIQNLIFSVGALSILFGFCFRLNIFTSKISNLLLPSGAFCTQI